uniref:protein-serine/threonine phosphatase n=1 Tax=Wollemia nobilis TaxID=56998 RepID=A0A0C9RQ65_9CONI
MLRSCFRPIERFLFTGRGVADRGDVLLWHRDLKPHVAGDFSIAVVQANSALEDQGQVLNSAFGTYIGVYDGHGGPEASRFINSNLFPHVEKFATEEGGISAEVLQKAFYATEQDFLQLVKRSWPTKPQIASVGSCCLVGAISNNTIYVANLGDSRAVLGSVCQTKKSVTAERLSTEHNAALEEVRKELRALHPDDSHIVVYRQGVWRVKGIIQVSRSIGDIYLKKPEFNKDPLFAQFGYPIPLQRPVMSAEPSILVRELKPQDQFLIFASDGLWEQLSEKEAVEIVHKNPRTGIAKRLIRAALQEVAKKREMRYSDLKKIERGVRRHFHDDITVIVIYLDHELLGAKTKLPLKKRGFDSTSVPVDIFSSSEMGVDESP